MERLVTLHYHNEIPERLDRFLSQQLTEFSRTRLQGLIEDGFVRVNGLVVTKNGHKLAFGDRVEVRVPPPAPSSLIPEAIPIEVLFENEDVVVINKPAGLVVHPAAGHDHGTLVHALLHHLPDLEGIGGEERPGIVHRLDKGTSGLMIVARNERAHRYLQDQFRLRRVEKTYLALVDGHPPTPSGRIEAPIGRDPLHRKRMAILHPGKGREAISEYRLLETFPAHALLEVHPLTGRTHQIRLHLAFLGCPVVGDTVYGRKKPTLAIERHFLHAYRLKIILPGESQPRLFQAPLPAELLAILDALRTRL
uniref:Pseudouridine synthase n=1 Tax=uncultured Chloroflexota bacterium TaxID=166587 RepID=H5S8P3_9CHLR|nr:ribosomal large subunit pseudouridine synthase D [uncultured Chloroflexota bacterium]